MIFETHEHYLIAIYNFTYNKLLNVIDISNYLFTIELMLIKYENREIDFSMAIREVLYNLSIIDN